MAEQGWRFTNVEPIHTYRWRLMNLTATAQRSTNQHTYQTADETGDRGGQRVCHPKVYNYAGKLK